MRSKHKPRGAKNSAGFAKEKIVPVAEGSLQSRSPGGGPGQLENQQSGLLGNRQAENVGSGSDQYGGGAGSQQSGWSARQQAQRMQARAEDERQGHSRQSGYGGLEQKQHAGNQESTSPDKGSMQSSGPSGAHKQASVNDPPSDFTSKHRPDGKLDSTR